MAKHYTIKLLNGETMYVEKINLNSKRGMVYISRYNNSLYDRVEQCYKRPSNYKIWAEQNLLDKKRKCDGSHYTIISYNAQHFTAAYRVDGINWFTGELEEWLIIETANHTYGICTNEPKLDFGVVFHRATNKNAK